MNINFLCQIFDDKETEYYVVQKWDKAHLVRVPTLILNKRCTPTIDLEIKDETLKSIKFMLNLPIDCNLCISEDIAPFQLGMTVGCIENFYKVECSISNFIKFIKDINKKGNQKLDFYDYYTLIQDIKKLEGK